jgi:hypothetical protein
LLPRFVPSHKTNAERENDKIKQSISMYAKPADEADPALASRVWCDSSDDSLINPVGRWHGVEQIMAFIAMRWVYSSRNLKITDIYTPTDSSELRSWI